MRRQKKFRNKLNGHLQAQRFGRVGQRALKLKQMAKQGPLIPTPVLKALSVLGLPASKPAYDKHLALLSAAYQDAMS